MRKFKEPNYKEYTTKELFEVLSSIDPKYKKRVKRINECIKLREENGTEEEKEEINEFRKKLELEEEASKNFKGPIIGIVYVSVIVGLSLFNGVIYTRHGTIPYEEHPLLFWSNITFYSFVSVHLIVRIIDIWILRKNEL